MENNIGSILEKRAHLSPGLEAWVCGSSGLRLTTRELADRSHRVANALLAQGVGKGDRVGLLLMNSAEFVESFFAIARIGAVIVPLNWRLVADELEFILKDSGTSALLFGDEFVDLVTDLHGRGDRTDIEHWVQVTDAAPAEFAEHFETWRDGCSTDAPPAVGSHDDMLYIMYTSGTTGLPKGVVHTHDTCLAAIQTLYPNTDIRPGDRYLQPLPLFHVGALTPATLTIYAGGTLINMRSFDPKLAWELIEREKINVGLGVPAMLNFMLQVPGHEDYDRSHLRWLLCGAAPVPLALIEGYAALGVDVLQIYGLTETCGPGCVIDPEHALSKKGSTGKAFFHTDVRITDNEGNELPAGTAGEVQLRGRHIMREYWNRPDATAETLVDGWLLTGDVGVMDEEGFVYIQDRKKDMVISGGENIYPAEIEGALQAHPNIVEAAVIGQPSERWGESPFAVVVRNDDSVDEAAVLRWATEKVARYKVPKGVAFVDEIPRNPSGKILKRILREQFPGPAAE